ncbi:unnamed protein product [Clonostachys rosea f. rosea IK726]|uniref:Uncharacterized protein n=1 Tax=Clonostachys rosea f. rosea IK726 TaxID=1349383 RepID=A0ACA9TMU3_BIOOC|nr:unnamed protein product [Clonostachys rosea f. rosea IK726]
MVQHNFKGPDAAAFLETVTPSDWRGQGSMQSKLTTFLWRETGGIGAEIHKDGEKVGTVTSGLPSPTVGKNIAMGYVKDGLHKAGTEVDVVVRGKKRSATVTKMPFTPAKYYKGDA